MSFRELVKEDITERKISSKESKVARLVIDIESDAANMLSYYDASNDDEAFKNIDTLISNLQKLKKMVL